MSKTVQTKVAAEKKVRAYNREATRAILDNQVVEVSVIIQMPDGTRETLRVVNPNRKLRMGEAGKSDNLWLGGAMEIPGAGKAQVGVNITPWGSKE